MKLTIHLKTSRVTKRLRSRRLFLHLFIHRLLHRLLPLLLYFLSHRHLRALLPGHLKEIKKTCSEDRDSPVTLIHFFSGTCTASREQILILHLEKEKEKLCVYVVESSPCPGLVIVMVGLLKMG